MQKADHRSLALSVSLAAALLAGVAHAGGHPRMVEAVTEPGFDKTQPVRIAAVSAKQKADPLFRTLANQLADALMAQGFKVSDGAEPTRQVVTLEYMTTGSGVGVQREGNITDPAYRSVIVTGYDVADAAHPKLTWQTMMDEYGVSLDAKTTIPPLIAAGTSYYGVSRTAKGMNVAAWCAEGRPQTGTLIPAVCSKNPDRPYDHQRAARSLAGTNDSTPPGSTSPGL